MEEEKKIKFINNCKEPNARQKLLDSKHLLDRIDYPSQDVVRYLLSRYRGKTEWIFILTDGTEIKIEE